MADNTAVSLTDPASYPSRTNTLLHRNICITASKKGSSPHIEMVQSSVCDTTCVMETRVNHKVGEGIVAEEIITSGEMTNIDGMKKEPSVAMPQEMESITAGTTDIADRVDKSAMAVQKPIILFKWGSRDRPFRCQKCEMSFETGESLQEHMNKHRLTDLDRKPFPCKICPKAFRSRKTLEKHTLVHFGQSTKRCKFCFRGFTNKENLENHMKEHCGQRPHKCPQCGESFAYKLGLSNHMVIHTGQKNFVCEFCMKAFNRKDILERHRILHTGGGKRHVCVECNKTFAHSFVLKRHARCVHSGESSPCTVCGKHIKGKENMSRHMKLHSGERPYMCSICGKAFTQNHHLKDHLMLHTKEKNYQCDQCPEAFVHKRSYTRHLQRHLGIERPLWQCQICARNFKEKSSLTKHMQLHDETSHQCKFCNMAFKWEKQLIRHLNKVHDDDIRLLALQKSQEANAESEGNRNNLHGNKRGDSPVIEVVYPSGDVSGTHAEVARTTTTTTMNAVINVPIAAVQPGEVQNVKGDNPDVKDRQQPSNVIMMILHDFRQCSKISNAKMGDNGPTQTSQRLKVDNTVVQENNRGNARAVSNYIKGRNTLTAKAIRSSAPGTVELLTCGSLVQQSLTAVKSLKDSVLSEHTVPESMEEIPAVDPVVKYDKKTEALNISNSRNIPQSSYSTQDVAIGSNPDADGEVLTHISKLKENELIQPDQATVVEAAVTDALVDDYDKPKIQGSMNIKNEECLGTVDEIPCQDTNKATDIYVDRHLSSMEQEHSNLIQSIIDYAEQLKKSGQS